MATFTWKAGTSADWSVAGDWTPLGGPPGTVATNADIATLGIGRAKYSVTIKASETFDINTLNIAGTTGLPTALSIAGSLFTDRLDYTGSNNQASKITVLPGGLLDIRAQTIVSTNVQTLTVDGTGAGAGGKLEFGTPSINGVDLFNAPFVTISFKNNTSGPSNGVIEFNSPAFNPGSTTTQPIKDARLGDSFVFDGGANFTGDTFTYLGKTRTLTVTSGSTPVLTMTNLSGTTAAPLFSTSFEGVGDAIVIVCYARGTRIATPAGEVPVEALSEGDYALTARGQARRIVWIGEGRVLATRGLRNAATPVILKKGALADNVPHRDLRVTKGHALYLDNVLIPVEFLVNHRSIVWDDHAQEIELYHIELEAHDVLLANGAPAESYRDDGNRWLFRNRNTGWGLPRKEPCAPVLIGGPVVDAVWRRLLERAGPRPGFVMTDDPDLHLQIDGRRLNVASRHGATYRFVLPWRPTDACIVSRAAAPAELGLARDPRVLGVAVRRIELRRGSRMRVASANDVRLSRGFHSFEADNDFRWTDGCGLLPSTLFDGLDGPANLVLEIACTTQYPLFGEMEAA
jgi:hypothetical protein